MLRTTAIAIGLSAALSLSAIASAAMSEKFDRAGLAEPGVSIADVQSDLHAPAALAANDTAVTTEEARGKFGGR